MKKLICYSATWCGPCKMFKPTLEKLIKEGMEIEIIDVDENQEEAVAKDISDVPTFILYDDGVEEGRASGLPTEADVRGWMV